MSLKHRVQAWGELLGRYRRVFAHFWSQRQALGPAELRAEEAEFLPAALALQARPVSPAARWVARLLIALVVVLVAWSVLGEADIVVMAQGKVTPRGQNKTLAAVETARVAALHVEEGQRVRAGELLIELDPRLVDSDRQRAELERGNARLQIARADALLAALDAGPGNGNGNGTGPARAPQLAPVPEAPPERWQAAQRHLLDQWRDFSARSARLDGEIQRLAQELPLAEQRAADYAQLLQTRDVARHAWMDKEQARLELQGQLADLRNQRAVLGAELRKAAQESRSEAQRQADAAEQELRKSHTRGELLRLHAPVDGTVQQLAVHTVGGVVPAAQPLMQIVPADARLLMEATVENRDIGFVREGQEAQVKIDTFEYTKYGTVPGVIEQVSRDAVTDEKRGPIYTVKVRLARDRLTVDGRDAAINPGMSGSVEIKTGSRRLIEYLLSPLLQHGRESLRER